MFTHACFDANELTSYYPRGGKELRGPFHTFAAADTVKWFQQHGVPVEEKERRRAHVSTGEYFTGIDRLFSPFTKNF